MKSVQVLEATVFLWLHTIHKLVDCLVHGLCIRSRFKKLFILQAGIIVITLVFTAWICRRLLDIWHPLVCITLCSTKSCNAGCSVQIEVHISIYRYKLSSFLCILSIYQYILVCTMYHISVYTVCTMYHISVYTLTLDTDIHSRAGSNNSLSISSCSISAFSPVSGHGLSDSAAAARRCPAISRIKNEHFPLFSRGYPALPLGGGSADGEQPLSTVCQFKLWNGSVHY